MSIPTTIYVVGNGPGLRPSLTNDLGVSGVDRGYASGTAMRFLSLMEYQFGCAPDALERIGQAERAIVSQKAAAA
ncbi:MAG: hypothetical protein OXN87_00085 [Chloroflexota bacterium]|nr:hypothetical protein [Chloroflexota bacterium]